MIVNWDFYVSRKRINVKQWLERKNIQDYSALIEVTNKLGIETPSEEKVSKYFEKPEINKNDKKIKKHEPTPDIVPDKISKKTEADTVPGLTKERSKDTESKLQEERKQTRKRTTRKKRKPVKEED